MNRKWKIIASLLLLIVAAHGAATIILGREVEAELAKIKARGEPVFAADLAGKPIPDSINGAVVYEKAFKLIPSNSADFWKSCDLLFEKDRKNPEAWTKARQVVAKYGAALDLVSQAQAMPKCRFKVNWQDGFYAKHPYCSKLGWMTKLAAIRAILQARDGDMSGAAKSIGMVLKMSSSAKDDAELGNIMFRKITIDWAADALREASEYGQFSNADSKTLAAEFADIHVAPSLTRGIQGERAMIMTLFYQIQKSHGDKLKEIFGDSRRPIQMLVPKIYTSYIGRPWFCLDQLHTLRFMDKQIKLYKLPYREIRSLGLSRIDKDSAGFIVAIITPVYIGVSRRVDLACAEARGSQILLALNIYKKQFGKYPASLADLKAIVPWKLNLQDPFSGKDFIYKRKAADYLLYSIGGNLQDEGGLDDHIPNPNTELKLPDNHDDIAWKSER